MVSASRARRLGKYFLLLDNLLVILGFFVVMPLISIRFVDGLGWAASVVGLALGLRQLTQQGLGIFGGSLADRFGARPLIVTGMLLRAAGFASLALADQPWILIASCVVSGLGGMLFDPPRSALIIKFTRPRERGRFISLMMVQDSAGSVFGALLGSWLLSYDFHYVCWTAAGLFCLAALCNACLLPAYRLSIARQPLKAGMHQVLSDKRFVMLVLTLSGYFILGVQVMLMLPILVKTLAGHAQAVGWMYMLDSVIALTLLYPLARWSEKRFSLHGRLMAGLGIMTLAMVMVALVNTLLPLFALIGLFYLGSSLAEPARETLLTSLANPTARGSYMGFSRIGLAFGGLAGYLGGGWLYDLGHQTGLLALPWLILGVIGVMTLLALWWQQPDRDAHFEFHPATSLH
mgnify:FL=1